VDHRADIYALGVVFYQMLTGELPGRKLEPPSSKVLIDVRLDEVVLRAMEKKPELRYQQAGVLKTDVETIAASPTIQKSQIRTAKSEHQDSRLAFIKIPFVILRDGKPMTNWPAVLGTGALMALLMAGCIIIAAAIHIPDALPRRVLFLMVLSFLALIPLWLFFEIQAGHRALDQGLQPLPLFAKRPNRLHRLVRTLLAAFFIAFVIRTFVAAPYRVPTDALAPEIPRGSQFLVWRLSRDFAPGDLVAYWHDGLASVGRVVRNEGGVFSVNQNGRTNAVVSRDAILGKIITIYWRASTSAESTQAFSIGRSFFPLGDSIEITSVTRSSDRMVVKGHYSLVSHDGAMLALYVTSTNGTSSTNQSLPEDAAQQKRISKGHGDFELTHSHLFPGLPHVAMYADGHNFADQYFGIQSEATQAEMRMREADLKAAQAAQGGREPFSPAASDAPKIQPVSALQFRLVADYNQSNSITETLTMRVSGGNSVAFKVLPEVLLDGSDVALAGIDMDASGNRSIQIRFTAAGMRRFAEITGANINRQIAVVFHGRILSAPVIRTPINVLDFTLQGWAISAEEAGEIVDDLNHATRPSSQMWEFSPPQECALLFPDAAADIRGWLDLDSGRLVTNKSIDWKEPAGEDWIQTNGLDLVAVRSGSASPQLYGYDLVVYPAGRNGWDSVTACDVIHNWELQTWVPRDNPPFAASPGNDGTFFFKTREGGKGILQILGNTADNRAARIRYKTVQYGSTLKTNSAAAGAVGGRNADVIRAQISQAEEEVARQQQLVRAGLATTSELEAAQGKLEVLKAELEGDEVGVAQARLAVARRALQRVSELVRVGVVSGSEAAAAQAEVRLREAELKAAQAAQGAATNAGPRMQIGQTNQD
jgi:signal peptidase I